MKKWKGFISATILSLTTLIAVCQDHASDFKKLQLENDTTGQIELLNKWNNSTLKIRNYLSHILITTSKKVGPR